MDTVADPAAGLDKLAFYRALRERDARLDGHTFNAVASTRIYCRTTCRVAPPRIENCAFFATTAQAEAAGYRPCLMCRPEIAPGAPCPAAPTLARRAADLARERCSNPDDAAIWESIAADTGCDAGEVRTAFEAEARVSCEQYLATCRLHLAKALAADCNASWSAVAQASGFASERALAEAFRAHYRLDLENVRCGARRRRPVVPSCASGRIEAKAGGAEDEANATPSNGHAADAPDAANSPRVAAGGPNAPAGELVMRLGYRPPYRFADLLAFFASRAIAGVEYADDASYARTVRVTAPGGREVFGWVRVFDDPKHSAVVLCASPSLAPAFSHVASRIRRQFDLDCDPHAVFEGLAALDDTAPGACILGTRVPGCFDPFETSVRAVLGQQVSVKAANVFAARLASAYGTAVDTDIAALDRVFPSPQEMLGIPDIEGALGSLGIIKTRSRTIAAIASALVSGGLHLGTGVDAPREIERLQSIKGIGPWSANYIAMRTMNYPDAFLETDVGIRDALPDTTPKERLAVSRTWSPYRSYANVSLWNHSWKG